MLAMHPETNEGASRDTFRLSDLGLVMRKDIVLATTMDIEFVAEDSRRHRAALDVPTRPPPPPRAHPTDIAISLIPSFPQRKISDVFLFVFVTTHTNTIAKLIQVEVGEFSIIRERSNAKINRSVIGSVGVAFFHQHSNHRDHSFDVIRRRRFGEVIRPLDPQGVQILKKCVFERLGEFRQRNPRCTTTPNRLVIDIGEIHHTRDF